MIALNKLCPKCQAVVKRAEEKKKRHARAGIKKLRANCAEARRLSKKGWSTARIAKHFDVTYQRAERMILPGGPQGWRRGRPTVDVQRLEALLAAGVTHREIAEQLCCHPVTVGKWSRKLR